MTMPESRQPALAGSDGKSLPRFSVPLLLKRLPPRSVAAPLSPRFLVRSTVVLGVRLSRQALGDLFDQVDVAVLDRVLSELAKRSWLTKYLIKLKPAAQRKGNLTLAVIGFLGDISAHFLSYRAHNCFYEPCSFHPRKAMLQRFIFVNL